jgi:asparagine synthase (glutamine-hydrolysing)
MQTLPGAWWLRRGLFAPEDLSALMGDDAAAEALRNFNAKACVETMAGRLPRDPRLALGQIESSTYLRNQLLRDSDWASMDHSVELRTPLVDACLLHDLAPLMPAFEAFPHKSLLAEAPRSILPDEIIRRPKTGFGIPVGEWLLRDGKGGGGGLDSRRWARRLVEGFERPAQHHLFP